MKSLKDVGLPLGFEGEDDYNSDTDEDEGEFYEGFLLATAMDFDDAVTALESFIEAHFGVEQQTSTEDVVGVRSWVSVCSTLDQEISAQLTDFGDHRGGYLRSTTKI
jgi:hypothetical protein